MIVKCLFVFTVCFSQSSFDQVPGNGKSEPSFCNTESNLCRTGYGNLTFVPDNFKKRTVENVSVFKQCSDDFPAAQSFGLIERLPDSIHFIYVRTLHATSLLNFLGKSVL